MVHMDDDDWVESTEGDLDYDLTEEAGYADWEPSDRTGLGTLMQAGLVLMLVVLIASALWVFVR